MRPDEVDEWNARYPVGTQIEVRRSLSGETHLARTSKPLRLWGNWEVLELEGGGCVMLSKVVRVFEAKEQGQRMANDYTSPILYHLVGNTRPLEHEQNFATLCAILESMEVRPCAVGGSRVGIRIQVDPTRQSTNGEPIFQTASCFCDIPFKSLALHASKYGYFGVGVAREWVAHWGGRPVIYVPTDNPRAGSINNYLCTEALNAWKGINEHFPIPDGPRSRYVGQPASTPAESALLAQRFIAKDVLAFIKTFDHRLPDNDPNNYYMEREWRMLTKLALEIPLREIVAPVEYHESLRTQFPHLAKIEIRPIPHTP